MSFADWHCGVYVATTDSQHGYIHMSTVDDLSYTPSEEEKYRNAAQIAATGRRSWKTLRGKGEAVWPSNLGASLIEAPEKYQPEGTRPNKLHGRFPMRNRFIPDYIFQITGMQVGSRLQQMRCTCKGGPKAETMTESSTASEGSRHASQMPYENSSSRDQPTVVYVEISVQPSTSPVPIIHFISNDIANPLIVCLSPSAVPAYQGHNVFRISRGSVLCTLSNTVEFASSCALTLRSVFDVYRDGSHSPIHTEDVLLECLSSPVQSPGWLYSTEITPAFWKTLCEKKDPTRHMILQRLTPIQSCRTSSVARRSSAPPELASSSQEISIVYHFNVVDEPDVDVPDTPSYYQSTSSHNDFVAPSQQHTSMDYQWGSSREHAAGWSYHQTQTVDQRYSTSMSTVPRYTQNDYADDHQYTHMPTDSSLKYGGSQYETGYSVSGISSWPNQHAQVPPSTMPIHR